MSIGCGGHDPLPFIGPNYIERGVITEKYLSKLKFLFVTKLREGTHNKFNKQIV